jgi:hypothetical protein
MAIVVRVGGGGVAASVRESRREKKEVPMFRPWIFALALIGCAPEAELGEPEPMPVPPDIAAKIGIQPGEDVVWSGIDPDAPKPPPPPIAELARSAAAADGAK